MKRKRADARDASASTPKKARPSITSSVVDDLTDDITALPSVQSTPSRSALKKQPSKVANGVTTTPKSSLKSKAHVNGNTPKSHRRVLFATPSQANGDIRQLKDSPNGKDRLDRSAQRKSARRLLERATAVEDGEEDGFSDEDELAKQILGKESVETADAIATDQPEVADLATEEAFEPEAPQPETPSKRPRGRPRKSDAEKAAAKKARQRSPTPPEHLPPHERYFYDHRAAGGAKATSSNTLANNELLDHDEYLEQLDRYVELHLDETESLIRNHAKAYDQWVFELENGFNLCLYGYGSKRRIVNDFAQHLHESLTAETASTTSKVVSKGPYIFVTNGYNPDCTPRDILQTLIAPFSSPSTKLPLKPAALVTHLFSILASIPSTHLYLLINSIDAAPLRRPTTQSILSQLSSHPQLSLIATADTALFPLLPFLQSSTSTNPPPPSDHNQQRTSTSPWLHHNTTTLLPLTLEASAASTFSAVDATLDLLGRSSQRALTGRDGVGFVLRSLPENARALYRLLVAEQLATADADADAGLAVNRNYDDGEDDDGKAGRPVAGAAGVEWSVLYRKAVEEFVCSNEMTFRTLLREFYDHQMVESKRDALGGEMLVAPFERGELEALLEDLVVM